MKNDATVRIRRTYCLVHTFGINRTGELGWHDSNYSRALNRSLSVYLIEWTSTAAQTFNTQLRTNSTRLNAMCVSTVCSVVLCVALRSACSYVVSLSLRLYAETLQRFPTKKKKIFSWTATFTCTAKIIVFSISVKIVSIVCLPRVDRTGWHHSYGIIFDKIFHNSPKYRAADSGVWW